MNRKELQELSRIRQREAQALIRSGHFLGSYYIAGYSVECALKACIAKQTRRYDFPDRKFANQAWSHDLKDLVKVAGIWPTLENDMSANSSLEVNWTVTKDWSEAFRYDLSITPEMATDFYSAISARTNGVLSWIKRRW